MADILTRRAALAAAIQHMPVPIRTEHLAAANGSAGFSGHRNTARKDARALVRGGVLAPLPGPGNRTYTRTETTVTAYFLCPAGGDCPHREAYDAAHQTTSPGTPADSDRAYDALVMHLLTFHNVPRAEAGGLASQTRRVVEPSPDAVVAFRDAQVRDGRWSS